MGRQVLPAVGISDTWLRWALDNRLIAFGIVMLMGSVSQGLTSSGAFEIYFNGASIDH